MTNTNTTNNTAVQHEAQATRASAAKKAASQAERETTRKIVNLSAFGNYCIAVADENNNTTFSAESMVAAGLTKTAAANIVKEAAKLYGLVGYMAMEREKLGHAINSDGDNYRENVRKAEQAVKAQAEALYLWAAWKNGKKVKTAKGAEHEKKPFYRMQEADFAIMGENAQLAREKATDAAAIPEKFAEILIISMGRMLAGKPMERLTEKNLEAARKIATKQKSEKAAATRKANAEKKEKEETEETVKAAKRASDMAKVAADLVNVITMSSATEEEKAQMNQLVKKLVAIAG